MRFSFFPWFSLHATVQHSLEKAINVPKSDYGMHVGPLNMPQIVSPIWMCPILSSLKKNLIHESSTFSDRPPGDLVYSHHTPSPSCKLCISSYSREHETTSRTQNSQHGNPPQRKTISRAHSDLHISLHLPRNKKEKT